jgi:hypothetical protein
MTEPYGDDNGSLRYSKIACRRSLVFTVTGVPVNRSLHFSGHSKERDRLSSVWEVGLSDFKITPVGIAIANTMIINVIVAAKHNACLFFGFIPEASFLPSAVIGER